MILQIDPERCQRCGQCLVELGCLGQVVDRPGRDQAPVIDEARCFGCGMCTLMCRHDAVVQESRGGVKQSE